MTRRSATLLLAFTTLLGAPLAAARAPSFFISVDGLQPALLETLAAKHRLGAERGFAWLLQDALVVDRAWPVVTTITAASHAGTITCSPPSRHGIIANNYLSGGRKVSGFTQPIRTEPLWRALMRQGKKVLCLAYVGCDGASPERRADWGLTYPVDGQMAPGLDRHWTVADLPRAQGWRLPPALAAQSELREAAFPVTLNPKTKETRTLHVLLEGSGAGRLWVAPDKALASDAPVQDVYIVAADGRKRRITVHASAPAAGQAELKVSRASYNNAYPETFRRRLDAENLVWPDTGHDATLPPAVIVERQGALDAFLAEVGARMTPELDADVVLFYQPLIDTLGHAEEARLPQPFDPDRADPVSQAFTAAFRRVDADLGRLLAQAGPASVIALMGDHGMDPVKKVVNAASLLPADHFGKVELLASGELLLLYAPYGEGGAAPSQAARDRADAIGAELAARLATLKDGAAPVLAAALRRRDFATGRAADYKKEWQYGEALWAFMGASGYWLQYEPLTPALFHESPAPGMHGTALGVPTMATTLIVHGPGLRAKHIAEGSLLDAVPTFTRLLRLAPPRDCLGHPLIDGVP